jgi:hypothetical protein
VRAFQSEDEKDSGLKANNDSGGKANGLRAINEPPKGGIKCRPGEYPCGNLKEVMRLRFELNLGYQEIGRNCANRLADPMRTPVTNANLPLS